MKLPLILVVEDNSATADLIREELRVLGYESILARDGKDAIAKAVSHLPDLIIMDISLPKIDGLTATSRIKEITKTRAIPILAATARALPEDRAHCIASGCDDYLAKPFTFRQLGAVLERLLKRGSR